MESSLDDVTVVMITRNRSAEAVRAVERLRALPEAPEVIVVDNASKDDTSLAVGGRPGVRVLVADRNLGAAGRNLGVASARTPFVAFADDDSGWSPGALARAARILRGHPGVGAVAGRVILRPSRRLEPVCAAMANSPLGIEHGLPGPSVLGFPACGVVVRRDAFLAVGGFHPAFEVGGEEDLLAIDLRTGGWTAVYVDAVEAWHEPSPMRDIGNRQRRLVRNALWTVWLRRPRKAAWRETARLVARALRRAGTVPGVWAAVIGLPWVLRERSVVPPDVEADLRRTEQRSGTTLPFP